MRLLVVLSILAAWVVPAAAVDVNELPVESVRVETEGLVNPDEVVATLGIEVGSPIDRRRLRRGIHALVAAGEVSWLEVDSEVLGDGLAVVVRLDVIPRLTVLTVKCPSLVWRFRVQRWLDMEIGDPVDADRIETAVQRVKRRLVSRGYTDAEVEAELVFHERSNAVEATIHAEPGVASRIADLRIAGLPAEVSAADVRPRFSRGKKIDPSLIAGIQESLESKMRRSGYWDARVVDFVREKTGEGEVLIAELDSGSRFHLSVSAPEGLEDAVLEAIPDPATEDLNPAQSSVLAARIQEELQLEGWLLAAVAVEVEEETPGHIEVRVQADPGVPREITEVEFPGAEQVPLKELREAVGVARGHGAGDTPVSNAGLAADRAALEDHLRRTGFVEARVGSPILEAEGPRGAVVRFPVDEGIRWTVDRFRVFGVPSEAAGSIDDDDYQLEATEAWNPKRLDDLVALWERAMADAGYPEAEMAVQIETPEPGRVQVGLWAEPGDFVRFGRVIVAGLEKTKSTVVERILRHAGLVEGEPYSQATVTRAQQELYRLGLFRRVGIVPVPGHELRVDRSVVVKLEEGFQRSYLVGLGWGTEDRFRLTLGWTHLNLFGGAHAFSLETRLSSRELRFQASLREPLLPWINRPGIFALYQTEESFTDYDQLRRGLWFEIGDRMRAPFRHWVRYEYQVVEPDAPDEILSELERDQQQIELSSITPSFEWDYRDDLLNPRSGLLVSLAAEYAFEALGAETEFLKLRGSVTQYFKTPRGRLALGLRVGGIHAPDLDEDEPANLQLPLAVRFFAGGSTSHRAFRTDRLGIPGETLEEDGSAIGGTATVLVNAEYQHTVWRELAAVVFVDGGNVWAEPEDVSLDDLRWGYGAGLRFDTAAGPLRLEYGRKTDRLEGESSGEFYVSFGVAF